MRVLIVEDDVIYVNALEVLLTEMKISSLNSTGDSEEAFRLIKAVKPNLILLDINLKGKRSGIEIAEYVRENNLPIIIMYLTSSIDEATFNKAKETFPYSYITKPLDKENFKRTFALACQHKKENFSYKTFKHSDSQIEQDYIIVKTDKVLQKINISDICLINVEGKYCSIIISKEEIRIKLSLKELIDKINSSEFMKVNRSCVVNIKKIESFDLKKEVVYIGENRIPISRRNKSKLMQVLL
ncbi:DNA-binding response regulator [Aquimarina sp. AD10]|uniref:LytR/AlgR family response regulator transcription factor n=1 Tax=Aquimarina sp. AD10 TaxID=1714849 RepID=UPI000E492FD9|nr:response regulator transcription factor [Aquimarina sp. AD10]AXT61979.1 DNA-binding response regulator [Aquimarina sp. AD10]RKN02438.1 response regulator [Aquimarina sp. AD10]